MSALIRKAIDGYQYVFQDLPDQRVITWPFVSKPYQVLTLVTLYLMFVLKWGPQWMKHRKPFHVNKIMIVYNAVQVVACLYLFVQAIIYTWGWKYKWVCEPCDYSETPESWQVAKLTYLYFILKVADLMDTVFFVLRKKDNQISFLHTYHHTGMVLLIWGATTYFPGGHGCMVGIINSFVHAVMYSYYLVTVAQPSFKNVIWIKRTITQMQILQFFLCVVHMSASVLKSDCEYPRWVSAVFLPQNLFMLVLFLDFYKKTYINKPKQEANQALNDTVNKNNRLKVNDTEDDVNKPVLNKYTTYDVTSIRGMNVHNKNNSRLNYNVNSSKGSNNHCENIIENSDPKYKKYD